MEHGLVVAVVALVLIAATELLARRVPVPAPVLQTMLGLVLGFVPGFPEIGLNPGFVLLVILPVLVYAAAVELPWEDFRQNLSPIATLAFGLVAATVAAVAVAAHAMIPALPWAAALVLGAIVSPTDPVASTAVASRIGVPQRLVAIIEGEGLVNDAVALTIKAMAAGALLGVPLSLATGIGRFGAIVIGEVAYGWALGWLVAAIRKRIEDSSAEIIVTLVTPFAAYLVPEALGGSGVLATVATGMYIGEQLPELVPYGTRLHLASVWQLIVYGLNGVLFLLTGLQFGAIWNGSRAGAGHVLLYGAAIAVTAILLRFCWTWAAVSLRHIAAAVLRREESMPPSRHLAFVAWSGMRGSISLAAALSLPMSVPYRSQIVFITACVIAATLLAQGTTLPWIIRLLRLDQDAALEREEIRKREAQVRRTAAAAALAALDDERGAVAEQVRRRYETIASGREPASSGQQVDTEAHIRHKAIAAQRQCLIEMHRRGEIPEVILRRIERELDLEQALLENRVAPPP